MEADGSSRIPRVAASKSLCTTGIPVEDRACCCADIASVGFE